MPSEYDSYDRVIALGYTVAFYFPKNPAERALSQLPPSPEDPPTPPRPKLLVTLAFSLGFLPTPVIRENPPSTSINQLPLGSSRLKWLDDAGYTDHTGAHPITSRPQHLRDDFCR
jgi:hypothetical protein